MKFNFIYILGFVISFPVCAQPVVKNGAKILKTGKVLPHVSAVASGAVATSATKASISTVRGMRALEKANTINTLSRKQLHQAALQMRENRVKADWSVMPEPKAAETHEWDLGSKGAVLTRLAPAQLAQAERRWMDAVESIQQLSAQIGPQIYYLGTSEAEYLLPAQIHQMLDDISNSLVLVEKAQVLWGKAPALSEMKVYLLKAQKFYSMLGSGMYEPLEEITVPVVSRRDNHVYDSPEFHLRINYKVKSPLAFHKLSWKYMKGLFTGAVKRGFLPENLRVALLQDDALAINDLKKMKQQHKLDGWEIDYLKPDPEAFLNSDYNKYDLILTDIVMPNGGGRYLVRNLRANGYEGSVIAVSNMPWYKEEFFEDGFDGGICIGDDEEHFAEWLWKRLDTYYFLKQKYGWIH